ncbi:lipopolysaccharide biosynthesis protein [Fluviibacterium sp. DFM31]|uniref:Lipopolysaccharide biosynthesis protein n=1 Tax=Meridianimarinicoccus marinus TaxID=3231483 RepID=A0ABV3LB85_9RHOB
MATKQRFSKGVAWMAVGNWSEQLVNFLVFMLLSRLLGAESFGLLTMAIVPVLLGEGLVRETLSEYVFSARDITDSDINTVFWALAAFGGLLSLILFFGGPLVAAFYGIKQVQYLMWAAVPIVFTTAITAVPVALLRRQMRLRPLAIRAVAGVVSGGIVGLGLALTGFGVWALIFQRIALNLTNVVLAWRAVDWRPSLQFDPRRLRMLTSFGSHVIGMRGAEMANIQMPSIVIGATLGPASLGYYTIAWRLVEICSFLIVTPLRMAALPSFTAQRSIGNTAGELLLDILRVASFVALPAFFGLAFVSEQVVVLFGGAKWLPAAPVLSILAFYGFFLCISKIEEAFAFAFGHVRELAFLANAALISGTLALVALSGQKLEWMVIAYVATAYLLSPLRWWLIGRHANLSIPRLMRPHFATLVGGLVMVAGLWVIDPYLLGIPAFPTLVIKAVVGIGLYAGVAMITMRRRLAMTQSYLSGLFRPAAPAAAPKTQDTPS